MKVYIYMYICVFKKQKQKTKIMGENDTSAIQYLVVACYIVYAILPFFSFADDEGLVIAYTVLVSVNLVVLCINEDMFSRLNYGLTKNSDMIIHRSLVFIALVLCVVNFIIDDKYSLHWAIAIPLTVEAGLLAIIHLREMCS